MKLPKRLTSVRTMVAAQPGTRALYIKFNSDTLEMFTRPVVMWAALDRGEERFDLDFLLEYPWCVVPLIYPNSICMDRPSLVGELARYGHWGDGNLEEAETFLGFITILMPDEKETDYADAAAGAHAWYLRDRQKETRKLRVVKNAKGEE